VLSTAFAGATFFVGALALVAPLKMDRVGRFCVVLVVGGEDFGGVGFDFVAALDFDPNNDSVGLEEAFDLG